MMPMIATISNWMSVTFVLLQFLHNLSSKRSLKNPMSLFSRLMRRLCLSAVSAVSTRELERFSKATPRHPEVTALFI
jgi:hypothetical protein